MVRIREAIAEDIQCLVELNREVQGVHIELFPDVFREPDPEKVAEWLNTMLADPSVTILLAEKDGVAAGYLILLKQIRPAHALVKERKCGYIDQVCVRQNFRRIGVFTALMDTAKQIVSDWGISRLELDVWTDNKNAKQAFLASGFTTYTEKMLLQLDVSGEKQEINRGS